MAALKYWVWLASRLGLGAYASNRLLEHFGSPEKVFFADERELHEVPRLSRRELDVLTDKSLGDARQILDDCTELGYTVMTLSDAMYPVRLRNIADPPLVLYIRGTLPILDEEAAVAVVGTRKATPYGLKAAERIGYELGRHGLVVVTGLARGIDSAAGRGALRAGGRVVGVVGAGLDVIYPAENRELFDDVAALGALVSEYPPGTPVASEHFPRRNRIMSGLSVGVAVIEAPLRSGALITAEYALEQGRDVFSLPGNVDSPACEGSNKLLREGAQLITSGREIAEEYKPLYPEKIQLTAQKIPLDPKRAEKLVRDTLSGKRQKAPKKEIDNEKTVEYIDLVKLREQLSDEEFRVISAIGPATRHIDEIIASTGLEAGAVLSILTLMELDGYVEQESGKYFKIIYEQKTAR